MFSYFIKFDLVHNIAKFLIMKKYIVSLIILIIIVPSGYFGYKEFQKHTEVNNKNLKFQKFQSKYKRLKETTPEDLSIMFLKIVKTNEGFKNWSSEMINSQIASLFRIDGEKKIDLCVEIILYKLKKFNNFDNPKEVVINYIRNLYQGKMDRFDKLIVKCFDDATKSFQKQLELELYNY